MTEKGEYCLLLKGEPLYILNVLFWKKNNYLYNSERKIATYYLYSSERTTDYLEIDWLFV